MSEEKSLNFIEEIIEEDIREGKVTHVLTRFPPEPNGYLHIGHAKSICLNFSLSQKYNGATNLRFDDTNPEREETEYVDSIKEDVRWLGFNWVNEFYASDYFEELYELAVKLVRKGLAYVDDSSPEKIASEKGSNTEPGIENEFRNRSIEENLLLFKQMKNGKFRDGEKVLRAKISMDSLNIHMRDPIMYRIKKAHHHRTGDDWVIYPMYDFAHGQSDSIENITHSICTLEFVSHRPLYDWFIQNLEIFPSRQYEFARLNMTYTVMSKRKLLGLVNDGHVSGWDDPRMPTISAFRRKGYTASSIRTFCERIGVAKRDNLIEIELLEFCIREELNTSAHRVMAVLHPVKLIIDNYEENKTEELATENLPNDPSNTRAISFSRELWIEKEDFMEEPVKKWFRLAPGMMVRLKSAYIIRCDRFIKDNAGNVTEIHCTYFPDSKSSQDTSGLKVKGTIHWLSIPHAIHAEVRLYDNLFRVPNVGMEEGDFRDYLNPHSLEVIPGAFIEPHIQNAEPGTRFQFVRNGYFCVDKDSKPGGLVFNRTVTLKDSFKK
ncbi:MAG: glutamine--tRNA ligase/YqeY domain fusion protein [Ginsengibacter sp.]